MKKLLTLLFSILIFGSCTTNYFLCETIAPVKMYSSPDLHSTYVEIPSGKNLISTGKYKKYRKARYGDNRGYVYKTKFRSEKKIANIYEWIFDSEMSAYRHYTTSSSPKKTTSNIPSTYRTKTSSSTSNGTVHVKGYYRKDGTYVKPHTRRAPRRR